MLHLLPDLAVQGTNVWYIDNDVMTYIGLIVKTPEATLDNDRGRVVISVPSDRVFGTVSVLAGEKLPTVKLVFLLAKGFTKLPNIR
jgi:hypothetical protein